MEHEGDDDTICNWCTWNNPQRIGKGTGKLENKNTNGDHPDNSIDKISQNIEKNPEDLKRFNVSQIPARNRLVQSPKA